MNDKSVGREEFFVTIYPFGLCIVKHNPVAHSYSLKVPIICLTERTLHKTNVTSSAYTSKKQCPSWPTGREVMTTSSCWVRGYNSTPSPTVQTALSRSTVLSAYATCFKFVLFDPALQIKLGRALGKTPLNPIHIWVKHVLPKIFWA